MTQHFLAWKLLPVSPTGSTARVRNASDLSHPLWQVGPGSGNTGSYHTSILSFSQCLCVLRCSSWDDHRFSPGLLQQPPKSLPAAAVYSQQQKLFQCKPDHLSSLLRTLQCLLVFQIKSQHPYDSLKGWMQLVFCYLFHLLSSHPSLTPCNHQPPWCSLATPDTLPSWGLCTCWSLCPERPCQLIHFL